MKGAKGANPRRFLKMGLLNCHVALASCERRLADARPLPIEHEEWLKVEIRDLKRAIALLERRH